MKLTKAMNDLPGIGLSEMFSEEEKACSKFGKCNIFQPWNAVAPLWMQISPPGMTFGRSWLL